MWRNDRISSARWSNGWPRGWKMSLTILMDGCGLAMPIRFWVIPRRQSRRLNTLKSCCRRCREMTRAVKPCKARWNGCARSGVGDRRCAGECEAGSRFGA